MFEGINFKADFLKQKATRRLFAKEQYLPSAVIDRGSLRAWQEGGSLDTFARAKVRAAKLLAAYERPEIPSEQESELHDMVKHAVRGAGMDELPDIAV